MVSESVKAALGPYIPSIERFAAERNLKVQPWFKDVAWALWFRHPLEGAGRIDVGILGSEKKVRIQGSFHRIDRESKTESSRYHEPVSAPETPEAFEKALTRILAILLAWEETDLTRAPAAPGWLAAPAEQAEYWKALPVPK